MRKRHPSTARYNGIEQDDAVHRICLLRVESHHSTLNRIRSGDLLPLDKGAAGKVLTAYLVEQRTPAQAGVLTQSMGERDPNCAAFASPVFNGAGEMCGAMSLSGPKERFTPAATCKIGNQVSAAAQRATAGLGERSPA